MFDKIKSNDFIHKIYERILSMITLISPVLNTKIYYRIGTGKKLNLTTPEGFNEKILWLKLNTYKNNQLVNQCADKYTVREFVKEKGWGESLPPLLHVYDSVDEIEWDKLPQKFAMKLNYGSGYNIICTDFSKFDKKIAEKKLKRWMKSKYYLSHSEMQYKYVPRKILIESFIETKKKDFPDDYKFYCFNGKPKYLLYCSERTETSPRKTLYDLEGNLLQYRNDTENRTFPNPESFDEMLELCKNLSAGFPFVRVDLYDMDGKAIFGELTFTPAGGTGKYNAEGNAILGSWIDI